jgi:hypothetical protein
MRFLERYLQLYLAFEQGEALQAWNCWSENGIATPFNDSLPKGEIGVNPPFRGPGPLCGGPRPATADCSTPSSSST